MTTEHTFNRLSDFALKIFAVVFMVLDHLGEYLGLPLIFRYVGRLAIPIFIFCCVQGCIHTSDPKKHLRNLYVFSLLMSIFDYWAGIETNFFRTLFSISLCIYLWEQYKKTQNRKIILKYLLWQFLSSVICMTVGMFLHEGVGAFILPALFGNVFNLEGGVFFVIVGLIFYKYRDNMTKLSIAYLVSVFIFIVLLQSDPYVAISGYVWLERCGIIGSVIAWIGYDFIGEFFLRINSYWYIPLSESYQWMMIGALPFLWMYNGERGRKCKYFGSITNFVG